MGIYKDEERGTWYCSFYYTDWQGNKKKKMKRGFKLQRDAKEWERKFLEGYAKNPAISFETLCDKYLDYLQPRVRESTFAIRKPIINNQILPYFRNLQLIDITPEVITSWQNELLSKHLSDTYTRSINVCLKAIFNYAVKYLGLSKNPCIETIGNKKARKISFWTPEEYLQFIKEFDISQPVELMYFTIFEILYYTGMREGELLALTPNDFDEKNKQIHISKTIYYAAGKEMLHPPKTAKGERTVDIPDFLVNEIKMYLAHLYDIGADDRIFPIFAQYIRRIMKQKIDSSGVKAIRVHDLRHSHASTLINLGANPVLVAERLGHESPDITLKTYSHLFPHKQADIVSKIEKIE